MSQTNSIKIKGARVHNLKNINVEIPRNKFIVITGLSGSGKSSLAFDTIYAEGQRRYAESLSSYARQFINLMDKPDVDLIEGLSPAISIDQKSASNNPRSTVGTITEIYDYLRLLFARIGTPHCPKCGQKIKQYTVDEIVNQIVKSFAGQDILILAPIIKGKKGEHKNILQSIAKAGYSYIRFDNNIYALEEIEDMQVDKQKKHNVDIVINRLTVAKNNKGENRPPCQRTGDHRLYLTKDIKKALDLANGLVTISPESNRRNHNSGNKAIPRSYDCLREITYSKSFACHKCGIHLPGLEPRNFSFNSPYGACPACSGLGAKLEIDSGLIINPNLTIAQGAIKPWARNTAADQALTRTLDAIARKHGFNINTPVKNLSEKQLNIVLYGSSDGGAKFEGVIPNLKHRYQHTESDWTRREIEQYMHSLVCPVCQGKRLKPEMLAVKIPNPLKDGSTPREERGKEQSRLLKNLSIHDVCDKTINQSKKFFAQLENSKKLSARDKKISAQIIKEIRARLNFLSNVGLDYLTLNRAASTLSGGEAQRIRLSAQIGSALAGVIYILDEPSIGLHQMDNNKLINTLKKLRDFGNTVIVVEHDQAAMLSADWIIDAGPGAGEHGGRIVAQGAPEKIKKSAKSLTGQYLSGKKFIPVPAKRRQGNGCRIKIINASEHNLKNINVEFPLGKFIAITGVSGSGKSTLITNTLARALAQKFYRAKARPGRHKSIKGIQYIDKVINIDQSPIGRTPRSNPATYTNVFTPIRELFAGLPEAKIRGYKAGHFSFNVAGGRCEACGGGGLVKIEMQFLSDIYVKCEACHGQRYNKETLKIYYKAGNSGAGLPDGGAGRSRESLGGTGKNISDVLNMTVGEAMNFFNPTPLNPYNGYEIKNIPTIHQKLSTLYEVGLGYVKLGQSATTLSGGEAQRIKLAAELSKRATGKTLYILDEPTTGLHFDDIKRLLIVLNKLVEKGNTVLIIEHNLDVIKSVDWIIDLGPKGGNKGGEIVAAGTPQDIARVKNSYTGQYLAKVLK
ncbi:MAG: excinuclease ABC subunit UvrA [Patescibacteria group bacterium]|nr:excinuclease ABC subunit UvrA [Patescibacteria group bacterium]